MFNALLCTFLKRSEKKTFRIFVTGKVKSALNFHILKDALIINSCFASDIKKVSHLTGKHFEK